MSYSASERETVCICDDETKTWTIETFMPTVITKMRKAKIKPDSIRDDGQHIYKNVDFGQVSFRAKSEKVMTEQQRKAAGERMKKMHEKKKGDIQN